MINRIGWNIGNNRQGYPQILWKTRFFDCCDYLRYDFRIFDRERVGMNEQSKNNDFYCGYGKHWIGKEYKIQRARQGDYICRTCEELRTKDWIKSAIFTRRKNDTHDANYDD